MFLRRLIASLYAAFGILAVTSACAQVKYIDDYTYKGVAECDFGKANILLTLVDKGPLAPDEFDDPCRSGNGYCNDSYARDFKNTRHVEAQFMLTPLEEKSAHESKTFVGKGTVLKRLPGQYKMNPAPLKTDKIVYNLTYDLALTPANKNPTLLNTSTFTLQIYTDIHTGERMTATLWHNGSCADVMMYKEKSRRKN